MTRHAARRDENEPALVQYAREVGAHMEQAPPLDWWCWFRGRWTPVEIKNPDGRNRLTEAQVLFLTRCKERAAPVWVWRTLSDVLESLNARRSA